MCMYMVRKCEKNEEMKTASKGGKVYIRFKPFFAG